MAWRAFFRYSIPTSTVVPRHKYDLHGDLSYCTAEPSEECLSWHDLTKRRIHVFGSIAELDASNVGTTVNGVPKPIECGKI